MDNDYYNRQVFKAHLRYRYREDLIKANMYDKLPQYYIDDFNKAKGAYYLLITLGLLLGKIDPRVWRRPSPSLDKV